MIVKVNIKFGVILGLDKTPESPLDCKEINPEYSLQGLMLKLQYFGHLMQRANSLMLGKTEGKRRE